MPSFEFLQRVGEFPFRGPRFDAPFAGGNGNPIQITRAFADEVMHKVMVWAPPGRRFNRDTKIGNALRRHQSSIGDVPGKTRGLRSEYPVPHDRVDAIGAHHQVAIGGCAVLEAYFDAIIELDQSDTSMVQMDDISRHRCGKKVQQLGAMEMIVRCAEILHACVGQWLT